jgi:hypothetical protein
VYAGRLVGIHGQEPDEFRQCCAIAQRHRGRAVRGPRTKFQRREGQRLGCSCLRARVVRAREQALRQREAGREKAGIDFRRVAPRRDRLVGQP